MLFSYENSISYLQKSIFGDKPKIFFSVCLRGSKIFV